jgi:hypothetical protein
MVLDKRGDQGTIGGEGTDGGFLVISHEATVADNIRAEDCGQLALHANCGRASGHQILPLRRIIFLSPHNCQQLFASW